jgi:hypothetical protein
MFFGWMLLVWEQGIQSKNIKFSDMSFKLKHQGIQFSWHEFQTPTPKASNQKTSGV